MTIKTIVCTYILIGILLYIDTKLTSSKKTDISLIDFFMSVALLPLMAVVFTIVYGIKTIRKIFRSYERL